jgi:biotin operon repressor
MTQCSQILQALQSGERLTVATALSRFGVYALSQRVGELKRQGFSIDTQMIELPNGKRIAEYRLSDG